METKMRPQSEKLKRNKGAAMLISVIFFLFISLAIISGLVSPTLREFRAAQVNLSSKKSYFLAESGSEDAMYRIIKNKTIGTSESITLDSNTVTTTITSVGSTQKRVVALGDVSGNQRKITSLLTTGDGEVFKYGTQAGQGGVVFHNNAFLNGNLYSNGDIVGSNGAYITSDAYVAGSSGTISNMRIGQSGTGNAYAHTVTGSTITGTIYCQIPVPPALSGNNKVCDTSREDPVAEALPITDDSITEWETDATNGGITNNNVTISSPTTLGAVKIIGDLTVNSTLTIGGTIYVTGNVILNVNSIVKLNSSYGTSSGIIVSDGYVVISNGVVFQDSGTAGSYIMFLSNSDCDASVTGSPCNAHNAIEISNNSSISIVNAQQGTVYFSNNATVKEVVGNKIELKNNVGISYGSGIIVDFSSGPSGSWNVQSWGESE